MSGKFSSKTTVEAGCDYEYLKWRKFLGVDVILIIEIALRKIVKRLFIIEGYEFY